MAEAGWATSMSANTWPTLSGVLLCFLATRVNILSYARHEQTLSTLRIAFPLQNFGYNVLLLSFSTYFKLACGGSPSAECFHLQRIIVGCVSATDTEHKYTLSA